MPLRPFQDTQVSVGALQDEMSRLIGRVWHAGVSTGPLDGQKWAPAIDIYEFSDHYTVCAEIPGVSGANVEVTHVGGGITIRGEKCDPLAEMEGGAAICSERRFGTFCRTVTLPGDIDTEQLSAKCHGGVLEITIRKCPSSMPKAVKIQIDAD